jgi:hypothetical protein
MAIFSVSIDSETRACTLTMNGIQVPVDDFFVSKYKDHENPEEYHLEMSYTQNVKNDAGMVEQRRFYLPAPEEKMEKTEHGLASEVIIDQKTAAENLIRLLNKG